MSPRRKARPALHPHLEEGWPADVRIIMSSLEAAASLDTKDRRALARRTYQVSAILTLFSDPPGRQARRLYTRDVTTRSLGFICEHRLPIGHGGYIELMDPEGRLTRIPCMLHRCREVVPGWYEGAVSFNREQFSFG